MSLKVALVRRPWPQQLQRAHSCYRGSPPWHGTGSTQPAAQHNEVLSSRTGKWDMP